MSGKMLHLLHAAFMQPADKQLTQSDTHVLLFDPSGTCTAQQYKLKEMVLLHKRMKHRSISRAAAQKIPHAFCQWIKQRDLSSPVISSTVGVILAATPQPNFLKIQRERSIMMKVTAPVQDEKSPMKALYSLGLGNCALILPFHVTSTKLMLIP